ncbi:MAG TPA: hypothetical protein VNB64_00335 [Solirubrobacteraceae bacterium]|nr:hypothetical protein [Solirubrobacteraceae bacterium]
MAATREVVIGFGVGQMLPVRVDDSEIDRLRSALPDGGWFELQHDDGTAQIRLDAVVFLRIDKDEHRVGFG